MKRVIKWGVLGTGAIVKKFLAGLAGLEDAQVLAVGSRTQETADAFAGAWRIPRAYGSYEALARDEELDVIYIGVPHSLHEACSVLCMSHGRNVLCEKPLCPDGAGARRMLRAAKENGVFLMEAMWTKFLPVIREVKRKIDAGAIGRVLFLEAAFGFFSEPDPAGRLYNPALGGGALLDVGIYPVALATFLMGRRPDTINAQAVMGSTGVDEINSVQFQYNNPEGTALAVLNSAIRAEQGCDACIFGTKGHILLPEFYHADTAVFRGTTGKPEKELSIPHPENGYEYEAMEVMDCIRAGRTESPLHSLSDSLMLMELLDEIRAAWKREAWPEPVDFKQNVK